METFYAVTHSGTPCGKVSVKQQGLYYVFHCRCTTDGKDMYRLMLFCGTQQHDLGILVPNGGGFGITTRLPVKQFESGEWTFALVSRSENHTTDFVPICPEEPFAYISRLKDSFLTYQNGQPGIITEKTQE